MADRNIFVLLIQKDPAETAFIRQSLSEPGEGRFRLQCVESVPTALARIGGGGVDVILLDLAVGCEDPAETLAGFLPIRQAARQVPVIVLYDAPDEGLALRAMRAGAADYLQKLGSSDAANRSIRSAIELVSKAGDVYVHEVAPPPPAGRIISFIGAKGGVGATTVALNVAAVLAKRHKVILVELRPTFGSLWAYLRPHGQSRNITHLVRNETAAHAPAQVKACLWQSATVPGLSVLFGPQSAAECRELKSDRAGELINALSRLADYVVLDLPDSLSDANRAAAKVSSRLILVAERDPVCVQSARLMLRAMTDWERPARPIELILVNRASPHRPMPLGEIETQLGLSPLGVVPPDPDVCLGAELAHIPVIAFEPNSLMAGSLVEVVEKCVSENSEIPVSA